MTRTRLMYVVGAVGVVLLWAVLTGIAYNSSGGISAYFPVGAGRLPVAATAGFVILVFTTALLYFVSRGHRVVSAISWFSTFQDTAILKIHNTARALGGAPFRSATSRSQQDRLRARAARVTGHAPSAHVQIPVTTCEFDRNTTDVSLPVRLFWTTVLLGLGPSLFGALFLHDGWGMGGLISQFRVDAYIVASLGVLLFAIRRVWVFFLRRGDPKRQAILLLGSSRGLTPVVGVRDSVLAQKRSANTTLGSEYRLTVTDPLTVTERARAWALRPPSNHGDVAGWYLDRHDALQSVDVALLLDGQEWATVAGCAAGGFTAFAVTPAMEKNFPLIGAFSKGPGQQCALVVVADPDQVWRWVVNHRFGTLISEILLFEQRTMQPMRDVLSNALTTVKQARKAMSVSVVAARTMRRWRHPVSRNVTMRGVWQLSSIAPAPAGDGEVVAPAEKPHTPWLDDPDSMRAIVEAVRQATTLMRGPMAAKVQIPVSTDAAHLTCCATLAAERKRRQAERSTARRLAVKLVVPYMDGIVGGTAQDAWLPAERLTLYLAAGVSGREARALEFGPNRPTEETLAVMAALHA